MPLRPAGASTRARQHRLPSSTGRSGARKCMTRQCRGVFHRHGCTPRALAWTGRWHLCKGAGRAGRNRRAEGGTRMSPHRRGRPTSGPAGPRVRTILHLGGRTSHPADPSTSWPPAQRTAWRREPGVPARGRHYCPRGYGRAPDMGTPVGLDLGGWPTRRAPGPRAQDRHRQVRLRARGRLQAVLPR